MTIAIFDQIIQPFDYPWSNPSTVLRTSARGMPFDKLKVPSEAEGPSLPASRQGLILSGVSHPVLKVGVSLQPGPSIELRALSLSKGSC